MSMQSTSKSLCFLLCWSSLWCTEHHATRFHPLFLQVIFVYTLCFNKFVTRLWEQNVLISLSLDKANDIVNPLYLQACSQNNKFCIWFLLLFGLKIRSLGKNTGKKCSEEWNRKLKQSNFYVSPLTRIQDLYILGDSICIVSKLKPFFYNILNI